MAGQTISVQVVGDAEVMQKLQRTSDGLIKMKPAMQDIADYLTGFFSGEVFASRGGVIGEPWPALNSHYAVWKARHFPGRPPLIRTGLMNRSFKADVGQVTARLYNTAKYFDYHQEGDGVPKRVMMKVDEQREQHVAQIVSNYVNQLLEKLS